MRSEKEKMLSTELHIIFAFAIMATRSYLNTRNNVEKEGNIHIF